MKLIIAGCSWFSPEPEDISDAVVDSGFTVKEVVSSGGSGVCLSGEGWAKGRRIPLFLFNSKASRAKRNAEMATYADALLVFWDGRGKSTGDMIRKMISMEKPVWVVMVQTLY